MTLTRLAFFRLLAAVGIGQATLKDCSLKNPCLTGNAGNISIAPTWKCAALDGRVIACDPKDGEEYCPLGHPQKPSHIYPVEYNNEPGQFEGSQSVDLSGKLHVCSVCGMVYVPSEGQAKP